MVILFLFLIFISILISRRPFYHPLVVTYVVWSVVILVYHTVDHGLYPLSPLFYFVLGVYLFSFSLGYIFILLLPKREIIDLSINYCYLDGSIKVNPFLYNFSLIMLLVIFFRYISILITGENVYVLSVQDRLPLDLKILNYVDKLILVIFFYLLLFNKEFKSKDYIFLILYILVTILKFGKLFLVQLFVGSITTLWIRRRITLKSIIILSLIVMILLVSIHYVRAKSTSLFEIIGDLPRMFSVYFLSPSTAFDLVLNREVNPGMGYTFSFFYKVMERFLGLQIQIGNPDFDGWVYVPQPTNVYTIMFPFYADFGIIGVFFFCFIQGCIFSFLYLMKDRPLGLLVYICLLYVLVLQFFAEIFFSYFSTMIQIIFWCYVVLYCSREKIEMQEEYLE